MEKERSEDPRAEQREANRERPTPRPRDEKDAWDATVKGGGSGSKDPNG